MVQDPHPVADPLHIGEDMGREDDRGPLAPVGDQRQQVAAALRVERADRFVEHQQAGLAPRGPARSPGVGASRPNSRRSGAGRRRRARPERASPRRGSGPLARPAPGACPPARPARGPSSSCSSADPGPGRRRRDARRGRAGPRRRRRPSRCPRSRVARPVIRRSVVVLPAPFGPSRPKTDPAGTSRSSAIHREDPATWPPNRLVRPRQPTATPLTPPRARSRGRRWDPSIPTKMTIRPHISLLSPRTRRSGRVMSHRAKIVRPIWIARIGSRSRRMPASFIASTIALDRRVVRRFRGACTPASMCQSGLRPTARLGPLHQIDRHEETTR